tara:strand:+ start:3182 stop:4804 length:1623 start_codon:yes stop_codon:yes gene_type:complete
MRFKEYAVGKITKQNTTADVKPGEIKRQAAKFGNKIGKDGKPPTLGKKIKGPKTNVLYNLGMAESKCGEGEYFCRKSQKCKPIPPGHIVKKDGTLVKENKEIASTTEIFIDMDGVLADFFTEWGKLMGKKDWRDIGAENISKALEKIKQTENFWLDLPLTSNAKNLINLVKQVKGEYNILSSPLPGDKNSEPHKREWIKKNLNFFPPKKVLIRHDKESFATQPDGTPNILIDDYGVNVRKWEASGGVGFKHKDHKFERTVQAIKKHIDAPAKENISEALDNPYPVKWEYLRREGGSRAKIKLPDDTVLDINITEADYGYYDIEFSRGGTLKPTGDGDEFRIFATVVAAVTQWWNQLDKENVMQVYFSADKADGRRSQLYKRFAQMFSKKIGWDYDYDDSGKTVAYGLTNPKYESYTRDQLPQIKQHNLKNFKHTLEYVDVNKIIPVQKERIMDNFKKQVDKIVAGDYNPIVVDCNNKIVNGHHRWEAAKLLGFEEMAVAKLPYKISTIVEKWSRKYKKSINCNNPKGFSQKAHCAGRKKK